MKRLRITVGDKTYDVSVETLDPTGNPVASASVTPMSAVSVGSVSASSATPKIEAAPGVVQSPLGGNVVGLPVTVGQTVQEGDQLVVLEAMKMNTYISAPESGKIAEIFVKVGEGVREGQPLLRIGE
jgi:oxaloacetate decarboxylase alpha subunit